MKSLLKKIILVLFSIFILHETNSMEFIYILNEESINKLYEDAKKTINSSEIVLIKTPLGLIIRFEIGDPQLEFYCLTNDTIIKLKKIETFLAKNKNPVIIEVHTDEKILSKESKVKNWELSTVISNKIEEYILNNISNVNRDGISSVGYGEFLPSKNTPNNGGKYYNRVDIIILRSLNGE